MRDKNRIKPKRWAYLAGLVDGDGSITVRSDSRAGYQLSLVIYSTNRILMKWLVHVFGGQFRNMPTTGNRKQKYCWYSYNDSVIRNLAPYLIIKQQQGRTAIQFLALESERTPLARQDLMNDLQRQNQTFVPLNKADIISAPPIVPSKVDCAYLAGLFDAEGSFSIHRKSGRGNGEFTSQARISNTDGTVFPWIFARFGGYFSINTKTQRDEGCWVMSGPDRVKHMLSILPYLVIKKQRATVFLQWIRDNKSLTRDEKILQFTIMKKLNKRGISPEANMLRPQITEAKIESDLYGNIQCEPAVMLAS